MNFDLKQLQLFVGKEFDNHYYWGVLVLILIIVFIDAFDGISIYGGSDTYR